MCHYILIVFPQYCIISLHSPRPPVQTKPTFCWPWPWELGSGGESVHLLVISPAPPQTAETSCRAWAKRGARLGGNGWGLKKLTHSKSSSNNNFHVCIYIYINKYRDIHIYIYTLCKLLMYCWTYHHQSSCIAATPVRDRAISFAQASRTSLQAAAHGDSVHVVASRLNLHLQPHPGQNPWGGHGVWSFYLSWMGVLVLGILQSTV